MRLLLGRLLAALFIWRRAVVAPRPPLPPPHDPRRRSVPGDGRAELAVVALLIGAAVAALVFVALYAFDDDTQLLGLAGGVALALLAAALLVAAARVVPQETAVEERPELDLRDEQREVARELRDGVEGVTRRRLLLAAGGVAAGSLGVAAAAPLASLGPRVGERLAASPWRRGRRLVDEDGRALRADAVVDGSFVTAFPEGADERDLASPVVVVRLPVADLALPADRAGWAPGGLLAYSKICTHAGCAISLFRKPTYPPVEKRAGLVCPCHYSTFDPARAGKVVFGPAGRPLPQLPLAVDDDGVLRAAGPLSGPVGPAWWGVAHAR
jgi:ubiquinol-cytochrome c reductase iron-sulfur subunit